MTQTPLRWLHLSDLHLGCRGEPAWWQTREVFGKALKEWCQRVGPPDLVLFTGDLTNRGTAAEFELLRKFTDWLNGCLRKAGATTDPLLLPVPGNHDLVRPTGFAARALRWDDELAVPAKFDDVIKVGVPEQLSSLFAPYVAWFAAEVRPRLEQHGKVHVSAFPGDYSVRLELAGRPPLVVVGLNSAWAHTKDVQPGELGLPPIQLHRALPPGDDGNPLAIFADAPHALLMMHHPPEWLAPAHQAEFKNSIYSADRFVACLHGHMHEASSDSRSQNAGATRTFFQSPSLFGADKYGQTNERPLSGFTFGELHDSGEVRLWPLRLTKTGNRFVLDEDFDTTREQSSEFVRLRAARTTGAVAITTPTKPDPDAPVLAAYRAEALAQHGHLELIGLDAGDYPLTLDDIYVPLSTSCGYEVLAEHARDLTSGKVARSYEDIELTALFQHTAKGRPHVVLLGEPGAGKSTALRKLLHLAFTAPQQLPGLAAGSVPVLLRLRDFTATDLTGNDLAPVFNRLLGDAARAGALWRQPHLLLLLDGLDEVPDALRPQVARFLRNALPRAKHVRAVLTSRIASYDEDVRLGEAATTCEVRPLKPAQIFVFIRQWFRVVQPKVRNLDAARAAAEADRLVKVLEAEQYGNQQLMSLVGSPLMLTLLCIVVLRGGEMPRQRVQFYERCLRVLLETWRKSQAGSDPLLLPDVAVEVLKPIAYRLHAANQQEVDELVLANWLDEQLVVRQLAPTGPEVLQWLHKGAGLLQSPAKGRFKFSHLGFQEYLTALHIADAGDTLRHHLVAQVGERWWLEVTLLYVSLPKHATFAPFVRDLLAKSQTQAQEELIKACLDTATAPDITPMLDSLEQAADDDRRAFLLRLLHGRQHPRLTELARKLCGSEHVDVRARAAQVLEYDERLAGEYDVVVVRDAHTVAPAQALGDALRAATMRLRTLAVEQVDELRRESQALVGKVRGFVALAAPAKVKTWTDAQVGASLQLIARRAPWRALLRQGQGKTALDELADTSQFDSVPALAAWITGKRQPAAPHTRSTASVDVLEGPHGIRLLLVPGGEFMMGYDGREDAQPIHRVRVSPFWLAETSITNAQYRAFLDATKHEAPPYWQNKRFNADDQPVVGVSWHDAKKFCGWLGEQMGRPVSLPTEAQREFAACGPENRPYPWGKEKPDNTRACYGLDWQKDKPAPVGSFPSGRGPFGHADLAGNVWEWCEDVWNAKAYGQREKGVVVDPLETTGDVKWRCLRGGGWGNSAEGLRVGIRSSYPADDRYRDIGFRVAVARPSTG